MCKRLCVTVCVQASVCKSFCVQKYLSKSLCVKPFVCESFCVSVCVNHLERCIIFSACTVYATWITADFVRWNSCFQQGRRRNSSLFLTPVIHHFLSGLTEVFLHVRCILSNSIRCFWASVSLLQKPFQAQCLSLHFWISNSQLQPDGGYMYALIGNLLVLCNMQLNVLNDLAKAKRRWTEKLLN